MLRRAWPVPHAPVPLFFFKGPPPTEACTLSLHDALPILPPAMGSTRTARSSEQSSGMRCSCDSWAQNQGAQPPPVEQDRKSTRLNSSHPSISYAVFCLKKKIRKGGRRAHLQLSHETRE